MPLITFWKVLCLIFSIILYVYTCWTSHYDDFEVDDDGYPFTDTQAEGRVHICEAIKHSSARPPREQCSVDDDDVVSSDRSSYSDSVLLDTYIHIHTYTYTYI